MNFRIIIFTLFIIILTSCITDSKEEAKTQQKSEVIQPDSILIFEKEPDTIDHELKNELPDCASLRFKFLNSEDGMYISGIVALNDLTEIDTLQVIDKKIPPLDSGQIITEDINFDNACDLVIIDDLSASHGTMSHYYYLFDIMTGKFIENKSLPERTAGIEVDTLNKGIILYCSYRDCKGFYKYKNDEFVLTEGEYSNDM